MSAYSVTSVDPTALTAAQFDRCLQLVVTGGAVHPRHVAEALRTAELIAIATLKDEIVGVGIRKRHAPKYLASLTSHSRFSLPAQALEIGHVAVDPLHRSQGLCRDMCETLLVEGPLFGTTSHPHMKSAFAALDFVPQGVEWPGDHRQGRWLSLWVRDASCRKAFHFEMPPGVFAEWPPHLKRWGMVGADPATDHFVPLTEAGCAGSVRPFAPSLACWQMLQSHGAFLNFMEREFPAWTPRRSPTGEIVRHGSSVSGNGVTLAREAVTRKVSRIERTPGGDGVVMVKTQRAILDEPRKQAGAQRFEPGVAVLRRRFVAAPVDQAPVQTTAPIRVEAIRGRYEYVQHGAWIDGEPIVTVTGCQDLGGDLVIKRGSLPYVRCAPVDLSEIFRGLHYTGFACVDFKIQEGQPKIFEINPRLGGSLVLGPDFDEVMRDTSKALGLS